MNLSRGERPVWLPVRTTSGPSAAITPSPLRTASSYSSAVARFVRTIRARTAADAGEAVEAGLAADICGRSPARGVLHRPAARDTGPEGAGGVGFRSRD